MKALIAALVLLPSLVHAQAEPLRVSLDSRGDDVREVLATLFAQAHRPYALDASIKGRLYVTLDRMPFPKALDVVMAQAGLAATERDGVTLISPKPPVPVAPKAPEVKKPEPKAVEKPAPKPVPTLVPATFAKRVTTRLNRAPLADVFAEFGRQAGVEIALDPAVPAYRVDAFFAKSSLRYALDRVCRAANLRYAVEGGRIVVELGS